MYSVGNYNALYSVILIFAVLALTSIDYMLLGYVMGRHVEHKHAAEEHVASEKTASLLGCWVASEETASLLGCWVASVSILVYYSENLTVFVDMLEVCHSYLKKAELLLLILFQ